MDVTEVRKEIFRRRGERRLKYHLANILVFIALFLDAASYYRQIKKVWITKRSSQVSSTSFLYRIAKALCAITALYIYKNFVGFGMECFMFCIYIVSLTVVAKYKPKTWKLIEWK